MYSVVETASQSFCSVGAEPSLEKTYVMRGAYSEKALETYHLILAPSFRCNLGCRHCYLPDHDALTLPKEQVFRLMDEWSEIVVSERGPFSGILHLKGGEPLILPYLNDVLNRLEDLKTLRFMMTTNGIAGSQEVVERLRRLRTALDGNVQVIVSIDGSNDAVNAQLRGHGNFDKAMAFVRMLREKDITVYLNNVVHNGNLDDIKPFVELALDLDVQQINFLSFVPKGHGARMHAGCLHPVEVFQRVQDIWKQGNARVRTLLAGSLSDILHAASCGTRASKECVGGYRGLLYIIPNGTVYSCPNLNYPGLEAGNILEETPLSRIHDTLLSIVYPKLRTSENEAKDRCLCIGEVFLIHSSIFPSNRLGELQLFGRTNLGDSVSYCFNRNW